MSVLTPLLLASAAVATGVYLLFFVSTLLHLRGRRTPPSLPSYPPLSLLKPLKGLEEDLEGCLESFFLQQYPGELELVFASASRDDPALAVARRLAARHPAVRARFVLSDENWGLNPKVANLQGALAAARHDLVLQTDANVRADADYAARIVDELLREGGSLLSSLVTGVGERSLSAAMENLQLSAYVAPACCAALRVGGVPCVIGKSMLFRKSELRELGGLERVKDSLAEDFLLGRHYVESGRKVLLSATPIRNVNVHMPLERSLSRHARWLKMRAVIHPASFLGDIFVNPLALGLLALLSSGLELAHLVAFAALVAAKTCGDAYLVWRVRGVALRPAYALIVPIKDVLMFGVWVYASVSRSVVWRGIRFRMGPDSQLLPDEGPLPVRMLRRLLSP
jgi:ceramide glucosyltransferase